MTYDLEACSTFISSRSQTEHTPKLPRFLCASVRCVVLNKISTYNQTNIGFCPRKKLLISQSPDKCRKSESITRWQRMIIAINFYFQTSRFRLKRRVYILFSTQIYYEMCGAGFRIDYSVILLMFKFEGINIVGKMFEP